MIENKVVDGVLHLMNKQIGSLSILRNIVWLMSNLCRNKNPAPPFEEIKRLLPVLAGLLTTDDNQVLADACWALSYVTDDENGKIQAVVEAGAVPHLIRLLSSEEQTIIVPALRTVGNIVTGTDEQVSLSLSFNDVMCSSYSHYWLLGKVSVFFLIL